MVAGVITSLQKKLRNGVMEHSLGTVQELDV